MCNEIENPENSNLPNLNISQVVRGRETRADHRVIYFPDNNVLEGQKVIPEKIVLKRWRMREFVHSFARGFRLSPNFWRAIGLALGNDAIKIKSLNENEIEISFTKHQDALRAKNFKAQSASNIIEIFKNLEIYQHDLQLLQYRINHYYLYSLDLQIQPDFRYYLIPLPNHSYLEKNHVMMPSQVKPVQAEFHQYLQIQIQG